MTIKITRDVNLDEKSIEIKDDKLTVHVSDNPNNKLVKTENGLEVLVESDGWIVKDIFNKYFDKNYPDYKQQSEPIQYYNIKTKETKRPEVMTHLERYETKTINTNNCKVSYTFSNPEVLNKDQFTDKYFNTLTYENFKFITGKDYYSDMFSFLVGNLVLKFELPKTEFKDTFDKDVLLQFNPVTDDLMYYFNFLYLFNKDHQYGNNNKTFGFKSLNKEVTEDEYNYYLTLTFDTYIECTFREEDSFVYEENYNNTLNNANRTLLHYFFFSHYVQEKIDSKYNIPVGIRTNYKSV